METSGRPEPGADGGLNVAAITHATSGAIIAAPEVA
ncbi:hypothetical protein L288_17880 [Sphingobium quisquiliarum P25]|uniref:Uncharacterized protein n=1 Tax=Sphingobium quisquiliarum P25 TaxID=1329909 RepID=T0GBT1_9SPHN|nr:hypothetical protein L288_17880 [Sphingobium quisquiliarum P25]